MSKSSEVSERLSVSRRKFIENLATMSAAGTVGLALGRIVPPPVFAGGNNTSNIDPPSYQIYNSSGTIIAVNGATNVIEFSGPNATTAVQYAINALSNGSIYVKEGVGTLGALVYKPGVMVMQETEGSFCFLNGSLAVKTKSGVPVDGDFGTAVDGLLQLDTQNDSVYQRSGGVWYQNALRFAIPYTCVCWYDGTQWHADLINGTQYVGTNGTLNSALNPAIASLASDSGGVSRCSVKVTPSRFAVGGGTGIALLDGPIDFSPFATTVTPALLHFDSKGVQIQAKSGVPDFNMMLNISARPNGNLTSGHEGISGQANQLAFTWLELGGISASASSPKVLYGLYVRDFNVGKISAQLLNGAFDSQVLFDQSNIITGDAPAHGGYNNIFEIGWLLSQGGNYGIHAYTDGAGMPSLWQSNRIMIGYLSRYPNLRDILIESASEAGCNRFDTGAIDGRGIKDNMGGNMYHLQSTLSGYTIDFGGAVFPNILTYNGQADSQNLVGCDFPHIVTVNSGNSTQFRRLPGVYGYQVLGQSGTVILKQITTPSNTAPQIYKVGGDIQITSGTGQVALQAIYTDNRGNSRTKTICSQIGGGDSVGQDITFATNPSTALAIQATLLSGAATYDATANFTVVRLG